MTTKKGHGSSKAGNVRTLDNGDSDFLGIVRASGDEEPMSIRPIVPGGTENARSIPTFRKTETVVNELFEPPGRCIEEPLVPLFGNIAVVRSTGDSKAPPQARTRTMGKSERIAIKAKGRILFIDVADIIAVEARGNHVLLLGSSGSHILRESISTIGKKLDSYEFVRIHRSVLVNAAMVEEMCPRPTGEWVLRVRGGREFTVTRTYKKNLQLLAQLWIGMEGSQGAAD